MLNYQRVIISKSHCPISQSVCDTSIIYWDYSDLTTTMAVRFGQDWNKSSSNNLAVFRRHTKNNLSQKPQENYITFRSGGFGDVGCHQRGSRMDWHLMPKCGASSAKVHMSCPEAVEAVEQQNSVVMFKAHLTIWVLTCLTTSQWPHHSQGIIFV